MLPINSFTSPTLLSTILNFLAGFCALLAIFLAVVAFSVIVSLAIVSAVHLVSKSLGRGSHDLEAGPPAGTTPPPAAAVEQQQQPGAVSSNRQIVEMLERIIRSVGEGRREAERLDKERRKEAMERLPPTIPYVSSPDASAQECVICLEELKDQEFCQVFPVCSHVFHSSCIGNWLHKNTTCPLCRTCILEDTTSSQK